MSGLLQRALQWSALCFCASSWLAAEAQPHAVCAAPRYDAAAEVAQVFDGDTVRLRDGRKLRLMGINTPELNPPSPGRSPDEQAEPLAAEAKRALDALLGETRRLYLLFGPQREDRYGRLLAHAYLADGRNVAAELLSEGLGFALIVPPNVALAECYVRSEQAAYEPRRGVWEESYFAPLPAAEVGAKASGFKIVSGVVQRVFRRGDTTWLQLSSVLSLRIRDVDRAHFGDADMNSWQGQSVTARGWLTPRSGRVTMRVRHPSALSVRP